MKRIKRAKRTSFSRGELNAKKMMETSANSQNWPLLSRSSMLVVINFRRAAAPSIEVQRRKGKTARAGTLNDSSMGTSETIHVEKGAIFILMTIARNSEMPSPMANLPNGMVGLDKINSNARGPRG
jgi:hypothetical protein